MKPVWALATIAGSVLSALLACTQDASPTSSLSVINQATASDTLQPRIWYDPYADVSWPTTLRLKAQTHDHTATTPARLLSYDSAGYNFVPLMDYSGVATLSYALTKRLWPAESVVAASVRSSVRNILAWVPSAEEVGHQHVTSLFLTNYIAKWDAGSFPSREPWMYGSANEAITLINELRAFPILAHPWGPWSWFQSLQGYRGMEIYSAYAEHRFGEQKTATSDDRFFAARNRNIDLVEAWDRVLLTGQFIVGVSVNDHFGPDRPLSAVTRRVRDSGKIIVLTDEATLAGFESAMRRGSVFAIVDYGEEKGLIPRIDSIRVRGDRIRVFSDGSVRWIVDGEPRGAGDGHIDLSALPPSSRYLRAEVRNANGSTIYLQPIQLRPRGDTNGDFLVDGEDDRVCAQVAAGTDTSAVRAAACAERPRTGSR